MKKTLLLSLILGLIFNLNFSQSITITSPNGGEMWDGSASYNVTWTTTGSVGMLDAYYSVDNGATWNFINDFIDPNSGSVSWFTPNTYSTQCLVRLTDYVVADTSDAVFTIGTPPSNNITITSPNGGESFTEGSSQVVTWNTTGTVGLLDMYYSINGGTTWTFYNDGINSTAGTYNWTIPNSVSSQCLVRLTDNIVSDESDANFSILAAGNSITLTSPNGGEVYNGNTTQTVTWTTTGTVGYLDAYYSDDNGATWVFYNDGIDPNLGTYNWTTPNVTSNQYLFRLYSWPLGDTSNATFTVNGAAANSISITSPNGGESYSGNTSQLVTWSTTGTVGMLDMYYSTNGGSSWTFYNDGINSATGSYTWTVPNVSSTQCLVRLVSGAVQDESDAGFEINAVAANDITITYPNGGETYTGNNSETVSWTYTGVVGLMDMYYSTNGGSSWIFYNDNIDPNAGSFAWTIPNVSSTQCLVKLQSGAIQDESDANFTINAAVSNSITVISPNGGESLQVGGIHSITWNTTGTVGTIDIDYSINGGSSWTSLATGLSGNSYNWTIPNTPSSSCLVRATDGSVQDESDATFSINASSIGSAVLVADYSFDKGTVEDDYGAIDGVRDHMFTTVDRFGCDNHAMLNANNINGFISFGDSFDDVIAATDSSFSVSLWCDGNIGGNSGMLFSKSSDGNCGENGRQMSLSMNSAGKLTFVSHYSVAFGNYDISTTSGSVPSTGWHHVVLVYDGSINSSGIDRVKIYIDNVLQNLTSGGSGGTLGVIQDGPAHFALGAQVKSDTTGCGNFYQEGVVDDVKFYGGKLDASDVDVLFNETKSCPSATLTITSPIIGATLYAGTPTNVDWTTTGSVTNVDLYYSIDAGKNFVSIATNVANSGTYSWTPPNTDALECLIRIEDSSNDFVLDESDNYFEIEGKSLDITYPNGTFITWQGNETRNIVWNSTGNINQVDLFISFDNQASWTNIASNITNNLASSTSYSYTVANVDALDCFVYVIESGAAISDTNDNDFKIEMVVDSIDIITPNGGQNYVANQIENIEWNYTGTISDVNILYSIDSGATYIPIVSNIANVSPYAWTIPSGFSSENCFVKIEDANNVLTNDISCARFTISDEHAITVNAPNGGEFFAAYSNELITWSSVGLFDEVDLYYSNNAGSSWISIITGIANNGVYSWALPINHGANYLVKVEESGNTSVFDESDAVFEIGTTGPGVLSHPNGGEVLTGASYDSITWNGNGNSGQYNIYLSTDNGATWNYQTDAQVVSGYIQWIVPNVSSTQCLIACEDDTSAATFTINSNAANITLTSPNGGEVMQGGDLHNITWDTVSNSHIDSVLLGFSSGGTSSYHPTFAIVANTGSYSWTVPNVGTTTASVKVSLQGYAINDESDASFIINEVGVDLTTPNGGEALNGGETHDITWTQTGAYSGVDIYLSVNNGTTYNLVASNVSGTTYSWTIPLVNSKQCLIKVDYQGVISDESVAVFTIQSPDNSLAYDVLYEGNNPNQRYQFQFLDNGMGYSMKHSGLSGSLDAVPYFTLDTGATWMPKPMSVSFSKFLIEIQLLNADTVFAHFIDINTGATIVDISTDLGDTWNNYFTVSYPDHSYVSTLYARFNVGLGVVSGSTIVNRDCDGEDIEIPWLATNGGSNVVDLTNAIPVEFERVKYIDFVDSQVGIVHLDNGSAGDNDEVVLTTTDGGNTWEIKVIEVDFENIQLVDENLVIATAGSNIHKSINGGDDWLVQSFGNRDYSSNWTNDGGSLIAVSKAWDIDFIDENNGVISLDDLTGNSTHMIRTNDGGGTFIYDSISTSVPGYNSLGITEKVQMLSQEKCYVAIGGHILESNGSTPLSIQEETAQLKVGSYPNPTNGMINFYGDFNALEDVTVYDMNGKLIVKLKNVNQLDLRGHENGVYFIQYFHKTSSGVMKIILNN
jgi:hypothetical protein